MLKKHKGELRVGRFVVPYRVYGDGDLAVVCVSGAQQTMAAWRPFVTRFSRQHAVVVYDPPGLGRSTILGGAPHVSLAEQVRVLRRVVNEGAGTRRRALCAASWGTIVTSAFAARHPHEVDRMILGSFGLQPNALLRHIIRSGREMFEEERVEEAGRLIVEGFGQRIKGSRREQIMRQFEELGREQAHTLYHHCGFVDACGSVEDLVDLSAIRATTLVVNGADDPIVDPQDAYPAAARIPDGWPMVVNGAGHFLHLERPEIIELYAEFIEERGRWATLEPVPAHAARARA